jgi:FecR protein
MFNHITHYVSAITFFAQTGEQTNGVTDGHVMFVTEIHFFVPKCPVSHSSLEVQDYRFVSFSGRSAMRTNMRTFGRLSISALPLIVLFAIASTVANAQTRIGTAGAVKPEASGSIGGTLSAGSSVHASESIRTGSSGQADLRFLDSSNMTVGPGSNVRLDKFVYDQNKGSGSVAVEASRGAFRFVTGSQNKGEVKVKTPSGTLGIRG